MYLWEIAAKVRRFSTYSSSVRTGSGFHILANVAAAIYRFCNFFKRNEFPPLASVRHFFEHEPIESESRLLPLGMEDKKSRNPSWHTSCLSKIKLQWLQKTIKMSHYVLEISTAFSEAYIHFFPHIWCDLVKSSCSDVWNVDLSGTVRTENVYVNSFWYVT